MPAFFTRSFSFTSNDATRVPRSSSLFSLVSVAAPTSWFGRIVANLRPSHKARRSGKEKLVAGHRDTQDERNTFISEPRYSAATTSSTLSIPSLSRSRSANSDTTYASGGALSSLRPPTRAQDKCNESEVITTLKAMQAFVPDSPRTSFIAPSPPDLELEEGSYSRRPSYVVNQPQLYPYTLSDDDIWAEQMVADILADHYRTKRVVQ